MASATILFDNSDGWLPIDFSEVSISRRAYRDGQNEYLINGKRVRLRDVSELLAKSGLSERTYTIVGQGLVDAALSLRADERRRLFEEAAGIGLYRSRREEAIRRLETTHHNIERIKDILVELKPRLRSLERQAERAKAYEVVRSELESELRQWYGYQWFLAGKEFREAEIAARDVQGRLRVARRVQNEFDERLAEFRSRSQTLRTQLDDGHRQVVAAQARRETVSRDLAVVEERMRSLEDRKGHLKTELQRFERELDIQKDHLARASREHAAQVKAIAQAQETLEPAREAFIADKEKLRTFDDRLQATRTELASMTARRAELEARKFELEARLHRYREQTRSASLALEESLRDRKQAEGALAEREASAQEARAARERSGAEVERLIARLTELDGERKKTQETLGIDRAEIVRIETELQVLADAEKSLVDYGSGARVLLQAARDSRLKGAIGALKTHLEVPAEYEVAIGAALGEYAEAVLLNSDGEPDDALQVLQGADARAALLPLARLALPDRILPPFDADCIGVGAELVQVPADLRPAIDLLLGRVLIVQNRPAAKRVAAAQPPGVRVVTLGGEVFLTEGPILAGAKNGASGLGRPRQSRVLKEALVAVRLRVEALESKLAGYDALRTALEGDRINADKTQRLARLEEDDKRSSYNQALLALERAEQQHIIRRSSLEQIEEAFQGSQQESDKILQEIAALTERIHRERGQVKTYTEQKAAIPIEASQRRLTECELELALAERAIIEAQSRLEDRQEACDRTLETIADLKGQMESLDREQEGLKLARARLGQEERQIAERIQWDEERLKPLQDELEDLDRGQEAFLDHEMGTRQALGTAEREYTRSQISLARQKEALEGLWRRLEDDFGLVYYENDLDSNGMPRFEIERVVENLPYVEELEPEIESSLKRKRIQLRRMSAFNPEVQSEYREVRERFEFLTQQLADLEESDEDIRRLIVELDGTIQQDFLQIYVRSGGSAVSRDIHPPVQRWFGGAYSDGSGRSDKHRY